MHVQLKLTDAKTRLNDKNIDRLQRQERDTYQTSLQCVLSEKIYYI